MVYADYIRTLNIDEPLARIKSDGTIRYYHADALGSIIALTDDPGQIRTQYNYSPFGETEIIGEPSDNPFQYTGRENDNTGLYYYRARYYSAGLKRFISEDPIGLMGGDINYYVYVGNNPLNFKDMLGLIYAGIGFGRWGNIGILGIGADSGIVVDSGGTICFYTTTCGSFGWNSWVGGTIGGVVQIGTGRLCSGVQKSKGDYWYGGTGAGGEGQVMVKGSLSYSRGIVGLTTGAGAGYITCETHYFCINESLSCKDSCKK